MFETMRKVFGPAMVVLIVGAISLVFVFTGITPGGGGGVGGGTAATVNGENIPYSVYEREYQRRVEFYQNMFKSQADPQLLERLGLRKQVLDDLINRTLIDQAATKMGMNVADGAVRDEIQGMPYFKKDKEGEFDAELYKRVLEANRTRPADFEEDIRRDLVRNRLLAFIRKASKVSDDEVRTEFLTTENRRQFDYVLLDREDARSRLVIPQSEITAFLKDQKNLKTAHAYYSANKYRYAKKAPAKKAKPEKNATPQKTEYKSFDVVKTAVVEELLKDRKTADIMKINRELANKIFEKSKVLSDKALKDYVKTLKLEMKTTAKFNAQEPPLPKLGQVPSIITEAFKVDSELKHGPKLFELGPNFIVAKNLKVFEPEKQSLEKEKDKLKNQILARKQEAFYRKWLSTLRDSADITVSKYIEGEGQEK